MFCDTTAEVLRLTREILERKTAQRAAEVQFEGSAA